MSDLRCHAGAGHGHAVDMGAYGVLCRPCWLGVLCVLGRVECGMCCDDVPRRDAVDIGGPEIGGEFLLCRECAKAPPATTRATTEEMAAMLGVEPEALR